MNVQYRIPLFLFLVGLMTGYMLHGVVRQPCRDLPAPTPSSAGRKKPTAIAVSPTIERLRRHAADLKRRTVELRKKREQVVVHPNPLTVGSAVVVPNDSLSASGCEAEDGQCIVLPEKVVVRDSLCERVIALQQEQLDTQDSIISLQQETETYLQDTLQQREAALDDCSKELRRLEKQLKQARRKDKWLSAAALLVSGGLLSLIIGNR